MKVIKPGQHGSTIGGNSLACAVAKEALQIFLDENLVDNALKLGKIFRNEMRHLIDSEVMLVGVRDKVLLNALIINSDMDSTLAWNLCMKLKEKGLLAKPTNGIKIRFARLC